MSAALELLRAAQEGDRDACEQAVLENNGLIWSVVRRYYGRGVEPDDLYQLGCLGFLKAVTGLRFCLRNLFFHLCRSQNRRRDPALSPGRRHDQGGPQRPGAGLNALQPSGSGCGRSWGGSRLFPSWRSGSAGHRRRSPRSIWLRKSRIPYSGKRRRAWRWRGSWGRKRRRMRWWSGSPCGKP